MKRGFWDRIYWPLFWTNFVSMPISLLTDKPGWALFNGTVAMLMLRARV